MTLEQYKKEIKNSLDTNELTKIDSFLVAASGELSSDETQELVSYTFGILKSELKGKLDIVSAKMDDPTISDTDLDMCDEFFKTATKKLEIGPRDKTKEN